ncbi:glycosyltransferase [Klebsiella aerogenes]|jgi:glycosyltransferase involved in cell wall biosynthesis|uniref:glycosyltransferase n=1 Tax=Klebsiella aerogenes TaxID=548 RepID=UPI00063C514A|nr:glycosyltransferase [Klebsiella aerogenes]KLE86406.1 glycosyl transferase family 1 [Klebsiella aerogenes]KTJ05839.1 glycosyltransferase [Klebsiella aerogenes]WHB04417.1 glycosyltransferase [Klebsiella aerogenes]
MKNIVCIMPYMGNSGAEKVMFNVMNNLDRNKFKPYILLYKCDNDKNSLIPFLKNDIEVSYLNINGRVRSCLFKYVFSIRKFCKFKKIDIILISDGTSNAAFSPFLWLFGRKIRKIARESNLPSLFEKNILIKGLYRFFYKNYDKVIVQSNEMYDELANKMHIPKQKIEKINNPLDFKYIQKMCAFGSEIVLPNNKINILTIGRLTYQKGFDLLLTAFSKIENEKYHLTIIGEGEQKSELIKLSNDLNIADKVSFISETNNPYAVMRSADVFVSSSRWEGYPNVVIEAIACGLPVVANDYPGGIKEIINSNNGIICNIEQQFANSLEHCLKLKNVALDKNTIDKIYIQYEQVLY